MITLNYQGLDGTQLHLFCREESIAVLVAIIQQGRYMHKDPLLYALYAPNMTIKSSKGSVEFPFFPGIKQLDLCSVSPAEDDAPLSALFNNSYLIRMPLMDAINAIPSSMETECMYRVSVIDQEVHLLPYLVYRNTFED